MASLIDPRCAVPLFAVDNEEHARQCGQISGYVGAAIITAIVLIVWGVWLATRGQGALTSVFSLNIALGVGMLFWLLPMASAWISTRHWLGYVEQIRSLRKKGQSHKEAVQNVQSLYQTDVQANAISSLGIGLSARR